MSIETIEKPQVAPETSIDGAPPLFGRCPVCKKPLSPKCIETGKPKAPKIGAGRDSRAICNGCGNIIEYIGDGKWKLVNPN